MKVFDGHCDTILRCYQSGHHFADNPGHWNIAKGKTFTNCAQFFACFGEPEDMPGRALWDVFREEVQLFHREVALSQTDMAFCTTAPELENAWAEGKIAAFLSAEGAELMDCDLEKLHQAHKMGVRAVNLTWNHTNALSGTNVEDTEKGLTNLGRDFVREMNKLGMLIDVSHLSDAGFWDTVNTTTAPIIASHSDSRACQNHTRNLTDDQFTAIIDLQGTVGLNLCADFLGEDPTVETVLRHLEHFLDLGGEDTVALGGDWDGITAMPAGFHDVTGWRTLHDYLQGRGYSSELLEKLFYRNLLRVVEKVCIT